MKTIYILLFTLIFNTFNLTGQIKYLGLGNTMSTDLTIFNDTIYASTYNGLYKKNINSLDTNWNTCGMQGNHVVQTLIKDNLTFISIVEIGTSQKTRIYKSINGGLSFNLLLPDTSVTDGYQYLDHLANPLNNFDTLYSLNHMKKTFDGGFTWLPIKYHSIRFIKVHPINHNEVFIGGENMIFSAELQQSTDYGNIFTYVNMSGYFGGDNVVHDMEFVGNRWICVGEGIISYTEDGGQNWKQAINTWSYPPPWSMYILDIEKSVSGFIYASGETNSTDRIGLFYSANNGVSWDTISFPSHNNTNPSTKCIAINSDNNFDNIFFGGNGVYLFKNDLTSIPSIESKTQTINIYPNPSNNGYFKIQFDNHLQEKIINITAIDYIGRYYNLNKNSSEQIFIEEKGVFILCIKTDKRTIFKRIICM